VSENMVASSSFSLVIDIEQRDIRSKNYCL